MTTALASFSCDALQRDRMLAFVARLSVLLTLSVFSAPVSAQGGPDDTDDAVQAFRDGAVAADELRWQDAERAFARAFELSSSPQALYMQGVALHALNRPVAARRVLRRVIELLGDDPENSDIVSEARALAERSESLIALLVVRPLNPAASLLVDGRALEVSSVEEVVEVDPGSHSLLVERDGHDTFVWSGEAAAGSRTVVEVVQSALVVDLRLPEDESRRRRRILIGTTASALLVLGATIAIVAARAATPTTLTPQFPRVFRVP